MCNTKPSNKQKPYDLWHERKGSDNVRFYLNLNNGTFWPFYPPLAPPPIFFMANCQQVISFSCPEQLPGCLWRCLVAE